MYQYQHLSQATPIYLYCVLLYNELYIYTIQWELPVSPALPVISLLLPLVPPPLVAVMDIVTN